MSDYVVLKELLDKCEVYFEGEIISKELLLEAYSNFVSNIMSDNENSVGIVLHTGSICFDIITIIYSVLSCIFYDETIPKDIMSSLNPGDIIIFDKSRAIYNGLDEKGYAKIYQEVKSHGYIMPMNSTVSPINFHKIKPYKGNAKRLDGRGLRNTSTERSKFIQKVFGKSLKEISGITKKSMVIVVDRLTADSLVRGIEIKYNSGKTTVKLTQLVTASYYTEGEEYRYSGNAGKSNAVLKFVSKSSIAREMIIDDDEEIIIGLLILSKEAFDNGKSELVSLVNRNSLNSVIISYSIEQDDYKVMDNEFGTARLFACTEELLLNNYKQSTNCNGIMEDFNKRIRNALYKRIFPKIIRTNGEWGIYEIKNAIKFLKNNYQNDNTEQFIIYSFSLVNLFTTAIFPLEVLETMIATGKMSIKSPKAMLDYLEKTYSESIGILAEKMKFISDKLKKTYTAIYSENLKFDNLIKSFIFSDNCKKRAIIVPKAYYKDIFLELLFKKTKRNFDCTIVTASKFDNSSYFDEIIVVGHPYGKKFDIFRCNASLVFTWYQYDFEVSHFSYLQQKFKYLEESYNKRMGDLVGYVNYELKKDTSTFIQTENEQKIDLELSVFIEELSMKRAVNSANIYKNSQDDIVLSDIYRIAVCTSGETIFFTKHYVPYIVDHEKSIVTEGDVSGISAGDCLIFTKNNNESQDIVDKILSDLCKQGTKSTTLLRDKYEKSKYWKSILRSYMNQNKLSYKDVSIQMRQYGLHKHEVTLRTWLNENSHIVGPRDVDTFYQIAQLCNDKKLLNNPESFFEACNYIRTTRIKILKLLGTTIIKNFIKTDEDNDEFYDYVASNITELSQLVQIESITNVQDVQVLSYMTNRPQNI